MTDAPRTPYGRWSVDERFMTVYRAGEDAAVRRGPRPPAATSVARPADGSAGDPAPAGSAAKPLPGSPADRPRGPAGGRAV